MMDDRRPGSPAGSPADSLDQGPLSHVPLLARLDAAEQADLLGRMSRRTVATGEAVFWMGEPGDAMYLIDSGRIDVSVASTGGEHITLASLSAGALFGEISLLDGGVRTATARATEQTVLLELMRDQFHDFLRRRPDAAIDLLVVMGQRQRASVEALRGVPNPNLEFANRNTTHWQRISDVIATVAASRWFTLFHIAWFGAWIIVNTLAHKGWLPKALAFDPFPFGLLTMMVSLEAIFLSIFVMVSQNRQGEKDRLRIDLDYQVNLKAQTDVVTIMRTLERIERRLDEAQR